MRAHRQRRLSPHAGCGDSPARARGRERWGLRLAAGGALVARPPLRVVVAGGGTGGHVYPALAILEALHDDRSLGDVAALYVGSHGGLEATIVPKAGVRFATVEAAPFVRRDPRAFGATVSVNVRGIVEAFRLLAREQPDILVATGGYVALPTVAALRLLRALGRSRARIALFEPNAVAGLANRLLAPLVDELWLAHAPTGRALRSREHAIGMPVRAALRAPRRPTAARAALGVPPGRSMVLVMGGSQGARSLNEATAGMLEAGGIPDVGFVVLAGAREHDALALRLAGRDDVRVLGYLDDPQPAYAAADLVVARAGASTLGELAATAAPALLVPYPFATADHQRRNAEAFAAGGSAHVVADAELDAARLRAEIVRALEPAALAAMRTAAANRAATDPGRAIAARVKAWRAPKNGRP